MGKEKTAHEQTLCFDGNACHWEALDHGFKVLCVYEGGETLLNQGLRGRSSGNPCDILEDGREHMDEVLPQDR